MSKSVRVVKIGDQRRTTEVLTSGQYEFPGGQEFLILDRVATCEVTQTFQYRYPALKRDAAWITTKHHLDTLKLIPTWWERVRAFFGGRPAPLPRAVAVIREKT